MEILRQILSRSDAGSQEMLLQALTAKGFKVTQATLSRDLQTLKAVKIPSRTGYRYILPDHPLYRHKPSANIPEFLQDKGLLGMEFSGNLVVLRTRPGYAVGIASEIDAQHTDSVCATVAGHDTILAVIREGASQEQVVDELAAVLPAVKSVFL